MARGWGGYGGAAVWAAYGGDGGRRRRRSLAVQRRRQLKRSGHLPLPLVNAASAALVADLANPPAAMIRPELSVAIRGLFFLNPAIERCESMLDFASSVAPVDLIFVPGDNRKYRRSSDSACLTTAALVHWLVEFHVKGYSLNGDINASDCGITHQGCLRGEQELLHKIKRLMETCGGKTRKLVLI